MHFGVKVIHIDFQLEKYIPFKEKDVSNCFPCSIKVTVTSQNDVPSCHMNQTVYTCKCCIHLNSFLCIALKWLKTSIEGLK